MIQIELLIEGIKNRLYKNGMSLRSVSLAMGYNNNYLSDKFRRKSLHVKDINKIAEILNIATWELITYADDTYFDQQGKIRQLNAELLECYHKIQSAP